MKKLFLLLGTLFLLASCSNTEINTETSALESATNESTAESTVALENPQIVISLSNGKTIKCELYPEIAPITVENFLSLVDSNFYNGLIFHRVVPGFVIQGGGFYIENNYVYQKSANTIKGEFEANGVKNDLLHTAGVLSMARSTSYDSASSQFFICVATASYLDKNYAGFGKTLDNESLANAIELSTATTTTVGYLQNFPINPVSIVSITRITNKTESDG